MGNGGPQVNSVLWLPDGYSSYRDERWRVWKLLMSTFQIWPQKNFFACGSPESRKGSDVTGRCGKCVYTTKKCFGILRVLLLVQRRAMARWKAGDEYISNLTSTKNFSIWITRKLGGGSDVTGDVGSPSTPGENVLWHWAFYCSYRDERWCVGKLVMSRIQIWHKKNFFASRCGESSGGTGEWRHQPGLSKTTIPDLGGRFIKLFNFLCQ